MGKSIEINCGSALMFKDDRGMLDKHDRISLNCGKLLISSAFNTKLIEKSASVNSGSTEVLDIKGEVTQVDENTVIDGTVSYAGRFVIALGNLMVQGDGAERLRDAEGVFVEGTLFYPSSSDMACLAKVRGKLRAYPDSAQVVLGNQNFENLLANATRDKKHIWVSDTIVALEEEPLIKARREGFTFTGHSLFTYASFNETYSDLFTTNERTLVPDGYEVVESVKAGALILYGPKLYVKGDLTLSERDAAELAEKEAIIVKGRANLPPVCIKAFRRIGKAAAYRVLDGTLREINGIEEFTHAQLQTMVKRGEKISVTVNGALRFTDDVTPEDMDCIASLSYNGVVHISAEARGALASRIGEANGFMGDLTSLQEFAKSFGGKVPFLDHQLLRFSDDEDEDSEDNVTRINAGVFVL